MANGHIDTRHQMCRTHQEEAKRIWSDFEKRTRDLEGSVGVIQQRLESGAKSFESLSKRLSAVEPKPPSILRIVSISLAAFLAASSALWALSDRLADRPTVQQVDKILGPIKSTQQALVDKVDTVTTSVNEIKTAVGANR